MLEIIKNSALANNKKETDLLRMERTSWFRGSRIQASSHPESKRLGVQSLSVPSLKVESPSI